MFNQGLEEDNEEDEGQRGEEQIEDSDKGSGESNDFITKWRWVYLVDSIAQLTNDSWDKVYEMNIYTFFNLLSYKNDKQAEEKRQMEMFKRK